MTTHWFKKYIWNISKLLEGNIEENFVNFLQIYALFSFHFKKSFKEYMNIIKVLPSIIYVSKFSLPEKRSLDAWIAVSMACGSCRWQNLFRETFRPGPYQHVISELFKIIGPTNLRAPTQETKILNKGTHNVTNHNLLLKALIGDFFGYLMCHLKSVWAIWYSLYLIFIS